MKFFTSVFFHTMELDYFNAVINLCIFIAVVRIRTSEQNDLGMKLLSSTKKNVTCGSLLQLRDVNNNTNISLTVANVMCDIISRNDFIQCQMTEGNESCGHVTVKSTNETENVINETFCYVSGVTFHQVKPQFTLKSGGTKIQFKGHNLDGVHLPQFVVHVDNGLLQYQKYNLIDCEVDLWQHVTCKTPNMVLEISKRSLANITTSCKTSQQPIQLIIASDPEFQNPKEDQYYISFSGRNIPVELKDEIKIIIGDISCNVTKVSENFVLCYSGLVRQTANEYFQNYTKKLNVTKQLSAVLFINFTVSVIIGNYQKQTYLVVKDERLKDSYNKNVLYATVTSSVLLVIGILVFLIVAVIKFRKMASLKKRNEQKCIRSLEQILLTVVDKEKDKIMDQLIVNINDLTLGKVLGSGNFGCVYEGVLKKDREILKVAVKTIKDSTDKLVDFEDFTREAIIMKNFHHPNVLELIGIAENFPGTPYVVLPYMDNGDLLTYVRKESLVISLHDVIKFGADIASGMAHLSSLNFVHRDLAARNCMLNSALTVKVADFGLCRDIYEKGYYTSDNKKSLPIRWMALESVEHGTYSTKSDVWSFGIVLWELLTRGLIPYPGVDGWDIVNFLRHQRLARPYFCPTSLYTIMTSCWAVLPDIRPEFTSLTRDLCKMIGDQQPSRSDHNSDNLCSAVQTSRYHILEQIDTSTKDDSHVTSETGNTITIQPVIDNIVIAVPKCYTLVTLL